jgi:hypothetical protein
VPKGWARGQLNLREFIYKRLQVLQSYNYSTTMLQVLTIMNIRYYNKHEQDDTRYKWTRLTSAQNVRIKRYSKYEDHSHKAKHAPIRIGLLFNGNH